MIEPEIHFVDTDSDDKFEFVPEEEYDDEEED
jgi:hypothetical protein